MSDQNPSAPDSSDSSEVATSELASTSASQLEGQSPPGGRSRLRWLGLVLVLLVLPLSLRLWPIAHGGPRPGYVPDTHYVKNALNMAKDKDLVPPAGTYSSYPYLIPYTLLPLYAADYVRGRAAGDWAGTGEYGARLQENSWRAHLIARVWCAIIAASVAFFLFMAARAAGLGLGAWVAGWLGATCLLHVQLSTHERPWAPLTAMMAATAWGAAVHARTASLRALMLAGVAAAAAFSMNPAGGAALLMAGVAWAVAPTRNMLAGPGVHVAPARPELQARLGRGFACVALFAAIAIVVGFPFYLRSGGVAAVPASELIREDQQGFFLGGIFMVVEFSYTTLKGLTRTFFGYDPVIFVLGLAGLWQALRRRALLPVVALIAAWGVFFMANINEQIRYILPMAVLMTLPAGRFAESLARRPIGRVILAVLMALPLVQALRLGHVMRQPDTRAVAEDLLGKLPGDAVVAVDVYGPVPPQTLETLRVTAQLRQRTGTELYGREAHRLMMLEAGLEQPEGLPILRIEDAFEYSLHLDGSWIRPVHPDAVGPLQLGETTATALKAMGATHILLTDRTPENGQLPPLLDTTPPGINLKTQQPEPKLGPLELGDAPIWTVHPAWSVASVPEEAAPVPDAHLPTTLKFPLRDLWRIRRPGPKLDLYELPQR